MPKIRSVQVTQVGGSSMRITLPIQWVKENKITHHSDLQIIEHGGVLVIFPPKIDNMDVDGLMTNIRSTLNFLKS